MNGLKHRIRNWNLEKKLIAAFSCFIIAPLILIGGIISWVYVDQNRSTVIEAAVENNKQIIKNIDTSLQPLLRLSMFPIQDATLYQIMRKNYDEVSNPLLEKGQDFDRVNGLIQSGIMLYTDIIDSVAIYHENNRFIVGRSNLEYMNYAYFQERFIDEPFVQTIRESKGHFVPIGIHRDELLSARGEQVVSVGRAILDPYTKQDLGFILFNISADRLKTLWSETAFSEQTRFYLIDEDQRIIHSAQPEEIGQHVADVLGSDAEVHDDDSGAVTRVSRDVYTISSSSALTGWKAVTVVPKKDLFSMVYLMVSVLALILILLLVLLIFTSVRIARTIMKPLSVLNHKMKLVSQGQLDVSFDTGLQGEIGDISRTVDQMLQEIRGLISRIYVEEEEKRRLEMNALQSQIRPHFIYNTLNVIRWLARMQGAAGIEEALQAFSSVIKFTAKKEGHVVTVAEEVEFLQNYTKILDFRYFNKFDVTYNIDPAVTEYRTLKFLLQPLVENAVFHGFEGIDYKGLLMVSIYEEDGALIMKVEDNGRGFPEQGQLEKPAAGPSDGFNSIGLTNIRNRIRLHFGPEYDLHIDRRAQGGTVVTIRVPIILEE
ncbi:sensor histidine kinase [Paenibacillus sp. FSL M8-0334]|uniref:cache domain-containing sensor histidine kinase n=1 Tax=Paenibacillus sp. FSL M8-0334 TaxID=2921623 RepID=UPI0030F771FB